MKSNKRSKSLRPRRVRQNLRERNSFPGVLPRPSTSKAETVSQECLTPFRIISDHPAAYLPVSSQVFARLWVGMAELPQAQFVKLGVFYCEGSSHLCLQFRQDHFFLGPFAVPLMFQGITRETLRPLHFGHAGEVFLPISILHGYY